MKRIIKKIAASRNDGQAASAVMRTASLSARDPLAYAAALKILG
jgi:hypothetical protein